MRAGADLVMPRTSANTAAAAAADERELSARSPRPAQKMGRYRILRLLGAGGMGAVYEAYDPELGRKLAIKVLRPLSDDDGNEARASHERARLLREAKTLARLSHPNIVSIFDVGILDDDAVFVAMELIAGETMRQFLERSATDKRIDWRMRLDVALQAGEGLAGAHAAGLLHRDFKPDNLMVGNDGVVRVLDFGLARDAHAQVGEEESSANDRPSLGWTSGTGEGSVSQTWSGESGAQSSKAQRNNSKTSKRRTDNDDLTRAGTLIGTPAYMAPEQLRGEPIQASGDLFALASVIFEALCGARPFPLEPISLRVQAIAVGQLKWPRYIPSWLSHLVGRALAFDPGERGDDVRGLVGQIRHGWVG